MKRKNAKRKATKKKSSSSLEHFLKNKIRRISYMWPPLKEAVVRARVSRGKYKCASCLGENFGPKEINRDHILPVEDPAEGFTTWDSYITRLFCSVDGIQILCLPCHEAKTFRENIVRREFKKDKRKDEEDI